MKLLEEIKELYGLENVRINFYPYVGTNLDTKDIHIIGFMQKNPFKEHEYSIFYCDEDADFKKLLLHECAHIKQYEDGDLKLVDGVEFWHGKEANTGRYRCRPHEKDARKKVRKARKKIK
jgi:hypothetical protein